MCDVLVPAPTTPPPLRDNLPHGGVFLAVPIPAIYTAPESISRERIVLAHPAAARLSVNSGKLVLNRSREQNGAKNASAKLIKSHGGNENHSLLLSILFIEGRYRIINFVTLSHIVEICQGVLGNQIRF